MPLHQSHPIGAFQIQSYDLAQWGAIVLSDDTDLKCKNRENEINDRNARPVCAHVDAADAQVVARANETRLELQSSRVCFYCLLAAVSVS